MTDAALPSTRPLTLIIGAGLAGLSTAYHLTFSKRPYRIFEKETQAGGMARSFNIDGFTFDFTGHLLHLHHPATKKLIASLLKGNTLLRRRNAWIYSQGVATRYPFQAYTNGLPDQVVDECILGFHRAVLKSARRSKHPVNFEEWCLRTFGEGISKHFMIPYNEKLFQIAAKKMTTEWCGPFVPMPKLEEVIGGALQNQDRAFGYNATFLYPARGGIQALPSALAQTASNIEYKADVSRVDWRKKNLILKDGRSIPYRHLVNTMPLPELLDRMPELPETIRRARRRLKSAGILCLNVGVHRAHISDKSWIYFPEKKYPFYRIGFPMNFSPHVVPKGCSSMYIEIPFSRVEAKTPSALFKEVHKSLLETGVLRSDDAIAVIQHLPIKYAYVIYDRFRSRALDIIGPFLERHHILSIGRYGGWKYSFMEEAIRDGQKAAQKIMGTRTGKQ